MFAAHKRLLATAAAALVLTGCNRSGTVELADGQFSVKVLDGATLQCTRLQRAIDCANYNIPNSSEGTEARVCTASTAATSMLLVTHKRADLARPLPTEDELTGVALNWSRCAKAELTTVQAFAAGTAQGQEYTLSTPLGQGRARVLIKGEYAVMAMALPKYAGPSNEQMRAFVGSLSAAR